MKFAYVQPIFCPNEEMFTRNELSVNSFYDYYDKLNYDFVCVFGGYCASDDLWNRIYSLIMTRSKGNAKITRFDRNYGKAYVVNKLVSTLEDCEYFLTADSDIIFKIDEIDIVDRLYEAFWLAKMRGMNPSLIALFQDQQNCHILELCYQNKYYYNGKYQYEMICRPNGNGGVAGGCICIDKRFWDLVGGYKVLGVYAADDANLMKDSVDRGYHFLLSNSIRCIHPFDTDAEYCNWKRLTCPNSTELMSAVADADKFWNKDDAFSYIIPHRTSTPDRERNLNYVISYLRNNFKNVEIIVIEQDDVEKFHNKDCKKILMKDSGPFKRSSCLNLGYMNAKYNKLIFADNDLLIPHEQIRESLRLLNEYDAVNPYKNVRDLPEDLTARLVVVDHFSILTKYHERGGVVFSGGACCFTKDGYLKIAGYDEDFVGWGGEDNACTHKIFNMLTYCEVDGYCWHMHHDRTISNNLHNDYENNLKILSKIESMSKRQLNMYCINKRKKYGW